MIFLKWILKNVFCYIIVFSVLLFNVVSADVPAENETLIEVMENISYDYSSHMPEINAKFAIVMDTETSRVLYEKNAYRKVPMASTTKIMSAIVALENGNLDDIVTVSKRAASIWGSDINLKKDEKLSLRDLLYGMMVKSGNDAAIAVAEHIGGSVEKFLEMMNKKSKELGAYNTCFKSPHGLDKEGHYSTAYDLAVITKYALENPVFSEIVSTQTINIKGRSLRSTNEMLFIYPGADGVKTGYTGKAGRCLVTSATRNGWRIISVVLNCSSRTKRAQSSRYILDYTYNNYKFYGLLEKNKIIAEIPVKRGLKQKVPIIPIEGIRMPLRTDELEALDMKVELPQNLMAPVYKNIEVGKISFYLDGKVLADMKLKTADIADKKTFRHYFMDIIRKWCMLMNVAVCIN